MNLIDSSEAINFFLKTIEADLANASAEEKFLTVDTEFIREGLKSPLLCLVQIATDRNVFIIDALALDISFLKKIFEDVEIKKIFHSARQDLEILMTRGINIENFFDTQLYEMILDTENSISYREIVYRYLGKKIKKQYSLSDWRQRPLSQKQILYCKDDVTYLRAVYKKQLHKLTELGRLEWLDDELIHLKHASYVNEGEKIFLTDHQQEIFQKLIALRKKMVENFDYAPTSLIDDNILIAICKKGADFVGKLKNSRNKKRKNAKEFFIAAEKLMKNYEIDKEKPSNHLRRDLLKVFLEICSEENQIAPSIIATMEELESLSRREMNLRCISGWRKEIFGERALKLLDGKIAVRIKNMEVFAEECK